MDLQTFSEIGSMILIATKLILDCYFIWDFSKSSQFSWSLSDMTL